MQFFKILVVRILTSKLVGRIIRFCFPRVIPSITLKGIRINNSKKLADTTRALFLSGLYETGELRFISKYLQRNQNVVELGASIGVVSSFVAQFKSPKKLILVEANTDLIDEMESNLRLNNVTEFIIINRGISNGLNSSLWFMPGRNNTTGQVSGEWRSGAVEIGCVELHSVVRDFNLEDFVLICDIEGAESFLFDNPANFKKCKMLIMELHATAANGTEISVDHLKQMIDSSGFRLIDEHGPIVVAERN